MKETVFVSYQTSTGVLRKRACICNNCLGERTFIKWIEPETYWDDIPDFLKEEFSKKIGNVLYEISGTYDKVDSRLVFKKPISKAKRLKNQRHDRKRRADKAARKKARELRYEKGFEV